MSFFLTTPIIYALQWGFAEDDLSHLLPIYNFTFEEFVAVFKEGYIAWAGYDLILLYFPYIIQQQKAFKHVSLGIWITTSIYLIFTIVSVSYFSEWKMENLLFPVLSLFQSVQLSVFERIDVMGISLWIFFLLATVSINLWAAKTGLDSLRSINKTHHLYILAIPVFIFISIPFSLGYEQLYRQYINYVQYGMFLWPSLLVIIHLIKFRKGKSVG